MAGRSEVNMHGAIGGSSIPVVVLVGIGDRDEELARTARGYVADLVHVPALIGSGSHAKHPHLAECVVH